MMLHIQEQIHIHLWSIWTMISAVSMTHQAVTFTLKVCRGSVPDNGFWTNPILQSKLQQDCSFYLANGPVIPVFQTAK
jgi:hypothetical protein